MSKIKEQISDDIEKGFVARMSRADAEEKYRGRLAVASLRAVPKALGSDEVRVVHDGSYSVDVNRRDELSLDAFQVGISQRKRDWIVK